MPVEYEKRDHIGIVTLSRPTARNAWGADFNEGIERHFDAMEEDDDIRCAILTGDESGGAFSAGANLKDPKTHTMGSGDFPEAADRRRQRLCGRHRLHRDVLLRSAGRLRAGGVAAAPGLARHPAGLRRRRAAGAPG